MRAYVALCIVTSEWERGGGMARARRREMGRPRQGTVIVASLIALVGVLAYLNVLKVPELQAMAFWLVVIAFVLLVLGVMLWGL